MQELPKNGKATTESTDHEVCCEAKQSPACVEEKYAPIRRAASAIVDPRLVANDARNRTSAGRNAQGPSRDRGRPAVPGGPLEAPVLFRRPVDRIPEHRPGNRSAGCWR